MLRYRRDRFGVGVGRCAVCHVGRACAPRRDRSGHSKLSVGNRASLDSSGGQVCRYAWAPCCASFVSPMAVIVVVRMWAHLFRTQVGVGRVCFAPSPRRATVGCECGPARACPQASWCSQGAQHELAHCSAGAASTVPWPEARVVFGVMWLLASSFGGGRMGSVFDRSLGLFLFEPQERAPRPGCTPARCVFAQVAHKSRAPRLSGGLLRRAGNSGRYRGRE